MLYDLFIKQYVGYAAYHQDDRNEITHFFGVPPIFMFISAQCRCFALAI